MFRENAYGPADGADLTLLMLSISFVRGTFVEVAWKKGIENFDRNVPSCFVRWMISLLPLTTAPLTLVPWPELTACAPLMFVPFGSVMNGAPGDESCLFATRLIAYLKLFAVTAVPSLNLKPFRIVKV